MTAQSYTLLKKMNFQKRKSSILGRNTYNPSKTRGNPNLSETHFEAVKQMFTRSSLFAHTVLPAIISRLEARACIPRWLSGTSSTAIRSNRMQIPRLLHGAGLCTPKLGRKIHFAIHLSCSSTFTRYCLGIMSCVYEMKRRFCPFCY